MNASDWVNSIPGVKPTDQFIALDRRLFEDCVKQALASTDMAGVGERSSRKLNDWISAALDGPQVEGLTSGEGLRALSARATPGPWAWEQCGDKEDVPVVGIAFPGDDPDCKSPYEGEFRDSDASRMTIAYDWQWCDGNSPSANAAFAVACVNHVRAMLAASPKTTATASMRELEREEAAHLRTIDERDAAEAALSAAYRAVCGRDRAWSNNFGYADAVREMEEATVTDSGTDATIGGERA